MSKKFRAQRKAGEALAIDHRANILDLLFTPVRENEYENSVAVVHVNGPLEHRACPYGDSYEAIMARFDEALTSDCETIALRVDSPGGVVSGLNQCVIEMQRRKVAHAKRVIVYVDELACSAAYALACVGDEIIVPPSGVVGSIGVRSEMCDQTEADAKAGVKWSIITSGERKAEGDPRIPTSDGAIKREQTRVDKLAAQFFAIVSDARGLSVDTIEGYQAGTFLGEVALDAGLVDGVMGWEELAAEIGLAQSVPRVQTSVAHSGTTATVLHGVNMSKIQALIAKAKKALAAEKDKSKRASLKAAIAKHEALLGLPSNVVAAALTAMKKTKYKLEEETTEEKPDDEDDDGEDDKDAEGGDDDADAESDDDEASAEGDDDEASAEDDEPKKKDAKKASRVSPGALAALQAQSAESKKLRAQVEKMQAERDQEKLQARIEGALKARKISPATAKMLRTKEASFVKDYLEIHNTPIVSTDEDAPRAASAAVTLSAAEKAMQEEALRAMGLDPSKVDVSHTVMNGGPAQAGATLQLSDLVKGN